MPCGFFRESPPFGLYSLEKARLIHFPAVKKNVYQSEKKKVIKVQEWSCSLGQLQLQPSSVTESAQVKLTLDSKISVLT